MAGRFVREAFRRKGLSDLEWKLFDDVFPKEPSKRGKGMPHAPYRHVLKKNSAIGEYIRLNQSVGDSDRAGE